MLMPTMAFETMAFETMAFVSAFGYTSRQPYG